MTDLVYVPKFSHFILILYARVLRYPETRLTRWNIPRLGIQHPNRLEVCPSIHKSFCIRTDLMYVLESSCILASSRNQNTSGLGLPAIIIKNIHFFLPYLLSVRYTKFFSSLLSLDSSGFHYQKGKAFVFETLLLTDDLVRCKEA